MTTVYLRKGERVRLSKIAIKRNIRPRNKAGVHGTVATDRIFNSKSYAVIWDDRKTVGRFHEDFLERIKP
jgi:hypothetical protein